MVTYIVRCAYTYLWQVSHTCGLYRAGQSLYTGTVVNHCSQLSAEKILINNGIFDRLQSKHFLHYIFCWGLKYSENNPVFIINVIFSRVRILHIIAFPYCNTRHCIAIYCSTSAYWDCLRYHLYCILLYHIALCYFILLHCNVLLEWFVLIFT